MEIKVLRRVRADSPDALVDFYTGGRRLKAFLFLHDVLPDGRPTLVANASHRTHYFSYDWLKGSRFADKYIRANYDVVPMTGKRGGGFIFDTNAIHKGTYCAEINQHCVAEPRRDNLISAQARCPGRAPAPCSSSSSWRLTRSLLCGTSGLGDPAGPPEKIKYRRVRTSATASSTARSSRRNVLTGPSKGPCLAG